MIGIRSKYAVKFGGIVVRLTSDEALMEPPSNYESFLTDAQHADIDIHVYYGDIPEFRLEERIFDSGGVWKLYNFQGGYLFTCNSPIVGPLPYKIAVFDRGFTQGKIYIRSLNCKIESNIDPLEYPLDEVLMVNYLSQREGIDVHAVGVVLESGGLVFIGVSGAGKSTLARLWRSRNVKILSDDRIIVRKMENGYWMHGTPWHGDALASLPDKAPMHGIYFLKQASENRIVTLDPAEAAKRLLVRCFPTFYSNKGMGDTLNLISELTTNIPSYELQFTPDQGAIDEVLHHVESHKNQDK